MSDPSFGQLQPELRLAFGTLDGWVRFAHSISRESTGVRSPLNVFCLRNWFALGCTRMALVIGQDAGAGGWMGR